MTTNDPTASPALVQAELEGGLPEFEAVEFTVDFQVADGAGEAVAWTYVAKPRPDRVFLGVRLTEALTLRGVTLLRRTGNGGAEFRWYVDWLDALNRAGLNAALRPVPDGRQPNLSELTSLLP
jgi:hypothetical protein